MNNTKFKKPIPGIFCDEPMWINKKEYNYKNIDHDISSKINSLEELRDIYWEYEEKELYKNFIDIGPNGSVICFPQASYFNLKKLKLLDYEYKEINLNDLEDYSIIFIYEKPKFN